MKRENLDDIVYSFRVTRDSSGAPAEDAGRVRPRAHSLCRRISSRMVTASGKVSWMARAR
jgi:hypothetical protein